MKKTFQNLQGLGRLTLLISSFTLTSLAWSQPLPFFAEPLVKDWKHFHSLPIKAKESFWKEVRSQNKHLGDLAWQWRLGFVQSCAQPARGNYCKEVLLTGLTDKAMVVRASAASSLGRVYEGSKNREIIEALQSAYQNPKNLRNGKPLIIQERILFALKEIGGEASMTIAKDLASKHQKTSVYWQKVSKW